MSSPQQHNDAISIHLIHPAPRICAQPGSPPLDRGSTGVASEDVMCTILGRLAARHAAHGDQLTATAVRGESPATRAR